MKAINGFSKLSKNEKINWLASTLDSESAELVHRMSHFWHQDEVTQKKFDEFSENTLTNFDLPFGVAPNFMINGKIYTVPMVIEESSVVAAASLAAKFWQTRGGFKAEVLSTTKLGQVHILWDGKKEDLINYFNQTLPEMYEVIKPITQNMETRGGGVKKIELIDLTAKMENYYQVVVHAETCNAMGANFINSILEEVGRFFQNKMNTLCPDNSFEVIMCILSNYTPECVVKCWVECPVQDLGVFANDMNAETFARRFVTAVNIAKVDPYRAVTHNKGIMNGVDAVILATGNDFRAIEACAHAYASRDGQYRSLTEASVNDGMFKFSITLPLAVGTVGGLTSLHPLAKTSLAILGNPSASELMMIVASTGLAQNFGAVKSLVTTGIQKGHMKLHLLNILNQFNANEEQIESAKTFFSDKVVSFTAVRNFLH